MFSRKNDQGTSAASTPAPADKQKRIPSVLAGGLTIEGNLKSDGDIHIDGLVKGNVQAKEIVIGTSGTVKGEVAALTVRVLGTVEGQIQGKAVTLAESAKVIGDILHMQLTIEPGAYLEGHCKRLQQKSAEESRDRKVAVLKQPATKEETAAQ